MAIPHAENAARWLALILMLPSCCFSVGCWDVSDWDQNVINVFLTSLIKGSRWPPNCKYQQINNWKEALLPLIGNQAIKSFRREQWRNGVEFSPIKNLDPSRKYFIEWHTSGYPLHTYLLVPDSGFRELLRNLSFLRVSIPLEGTRTNVMII